MLLQRVIKITLKVNILGGFINYIFSFKHSKLVLLCLGVDLYFLQENSCLCGVVVQGNAFVGPKYQLPL